MSPDEIVRLCKAHTLYTWSRQDQVNPLPIASASGAWVVAADGRRFLDLNSQSMSVNIGHGHPKVIAAMKAQLDEIPFVAPAAATEVRARLGALLAEIMPGPINTFLFTSGGAEANENAIKAARWVTGRQKIMARYRSYHGATAGALAATGDPRRWSGEPGPSGVIHVLDPQPYGFSFGRTEAEVAAQHLRYIEEVIRMEGSDRIAAFMMETVSGTNGVLPPPAGYLKDLQGLLRRHGILMILDEVMTGFGRTGRMFGFEHYGIQPDLVTMAKGLTSSYAPLGAVGISDAIVAYFQAQPFTSGLTYNAHPVGLAAAEANIKVLQDEGLVARSAALGVQLKRRLLAIQANHKSVGATRCLGLFAMIDLVGADGDLITAVGTSHPAVTAFKNRMFEGGFTIYTRWSHILIVPPLCISEADLTLALDAIDDALSIVDADV